MKLPKLIQIPNPFISSNVKRNWCQTVNFSQLWKAQPQSLKWCSKCLSKWYYTCHKLYKPSHSYLPLFRATDTYTLTSVSCEKRSPRASNGVLNASASNIILATSFTSHPTHIFHCLEQLTLITLTSVSCEKHSPRASNGFLNASASDIILTTSFTSRPTHIFHHLEQLTLISWHQSVAKSAVTEPQMVF